MEVYTLNSLFQRVAVIDVFESLIWTERFSEWGDFELHLISTPEMRRLLPTGTRLAMSHSYRVMTVELVEDSVDTEGRALMKVSGRSIESILDDRTARNTFAGLEETPKWEIEGTPGAIARKVFNDICRNNSNFPDDEIPFLVSGSLFPSGTIPESTEVITVELDLNSVYEVVRDLCDTYELGFRLLRNFDKSELYFDIYSGNNRTTFQTNFEPVVFAPNLDNLIDINSVVSISDYKNVAYVFHDYGSQIVTADGISPEVDGFDRRVLAVSATDIAVPERPYTVSESQQNAINAALKLDTILEPQKEALDKLLKKLKLNAKDLTALTQVLSSTKLTSAQKGQITNARNVSTSYDPTEMAWLNGQLQLRGRDELAKHRQFSALDGQLPPSSPYPYQVAYHLGDLVEMRDDDGVTNQMRVTEQIFVQDGQGERSYPTLITSQIIVPGTWAGWNRNMVWENAPGEWDDA